MLRKNLQKTAENSPVNSATPAEVLNPTRTAQLYAFNLYPPSEALSPFVDSYWIMRWDMTGKEPFTAEVIPSPYTNLTFMPEGSRITGVTTGKYSYTLSGIGAIVGVKFRPGGFRTFYGKNVKTLTDRHIEAVKVFPTIKPTTHKTVMKMSDTEAVAFLEILLSSSQPHTDRNLAIVTRILAEVESNESATITELISEYRLSSRRIHEIFQEYVGVGLKHILLRSKLLKAVTAPLDGRVSWTDIAAELGYSDQSHFTNDFKRIIGKSPRQYAEEIKQG